MSAAIVTLTTDFGSGSPYVAEMKAVLLRRVPHATIVDVTHAIRPQQILQAARVVARVAFQFPPGSAHVVVVDPGVGTGRTIVACEVDSQWFVAPNNGVLAQAARRGPARVVRLDQPRFWQDPVSATFHGRDIMAPAAAELLSGTPLETLGTAGETLLELETPRVQRLSQIEIRGEVVEVDQFGNLITNITKAELGAVPPSGVVCGGRQPDWVRTYGERSPGTCVALLGSSDALEVAVVCGNAARTLGLDVGAAVTVFLGP